MSPEQAVGNNDTLDERSDLFSASVMFAELLSLRHYLADRTSVADVLDGVINEDCYRRYALELAACTLPAEMKHVVQKGMWREPDKRWQSAQEMATAFERTLSGDIWVACPFTLTRRTSFVVTRWANRNQTAFLALLVGSPLALLAAGVAMAWLALR